MKDLDPYRILDTHELLNNCFTQYCNCGIEEEYYFSFFIYILEKEIEYILEVRVKNKDEIFGGDISYFITKDKKRKQVQKKEIDTLIKTNWEDIYRIANERNWINLIRSKIDNGNKIVSITKREADSILCGIDAVNSRHFQDSKIAFDFNTDVKNIKDKLQRAFREDDYGQKEKN
jgi:hypothetical protein